MTSIAQNKRVVNNLYPFYKVYVASDYEDSQIKTPHIKKLAAKLTDVYKNKINKLCVAMPPRHSKSSMVTLAFPLWLIFRNPNLKILIVNAESSLSENFGIRLREYVKRYGPNFNVHLSDVKHSSTHLMFERADGTLCKGSIRLVGASGSITGQDADYLIIDDPYKGFEDITPTLLTKKVEWFKTMILQRLEPHSKLIILHTRWHSDDLQGYLKENYPEDYDFIEFSAIKEDGTLLWPERYTLKYLQKQAKQMGERLFQSLFQQKPIDETGDFFRMENLIFEDSFDDYMIAKCRSWDIASSDDTLGDKRDYSVGIRMCKTATGQYWIFDYERGQYGNDVLNVIKRTAQLDSPNYTILLETGTKGGAAGLLYNDYKDALSGYNTHQSDPTAMTKPDRATPFKYAVYDGLVHVMIKNENLRQVFIDELKAFPNGKHDDIVDACAHGYNWLKTHGDNQVSTAGKRRRARI